MLLACLFFAAAALAAPPEPGPSPSRRTVRLLEKADSAGDVGDWAAAERYAERILRKDANPRARELQVLAQLDRFIGAVRELQQQGATELPASFEILEELERRLRILEEAAPNSIILGVARNAIDATQNPVLLSVLEPACSAAATDHFHSAEAAFASGRYDDALVAYDAALEVCPDNSVWWTWSGDAALRAQGTDEAMRRYQEALARSPCNHAAHRFIADVGFQVEPVTSELVHSSLRAALSAVACKPDYLPGWATLQGWAGTTRMLLIQGTMDELDEPGLRALLTATALEQEGSPLDRRVAAFHRMKSSQNSLLFGLLGQVEDEALLRVVLAWETMDRSLAPEFRELREEALPVLVEWIARTRLRPIPPEALPAE